MTSQQFQGWILGMITLAIAWFAFDQFRNVWADMHTDQDVLERVAHDEGHWERCSKCRHQKQIFDWKKKTKCEWCKHVE